MIQKKNLNTLNKMLDNKQIRQYNLINNGEK